ncbi:MAG: hypothetical protein HW402_859 [Dehalococcoidales bacterium]|nr:hypothetical protein [Dehalococcoidales bacterium]
MTTQSFLIAGSAVALALTLCFLSIGTSIMVRLKKPGAAWAMVWFIMSVIALAVYAFLWQLALGNISLGNATANTKETVNVSPLWFSAIGTTSLAVMTFYMSVVKPLRERPKFTIEFDNKEPFCRKDPPNQGQIYWLRVKVTNSGKSVAKRCMGRLVQFSDGEGKPVEDHEPVQLHWVGTPWTTGPEFFTLIDLQQSRSEFLDVLLTKPETNPASRPPPRLFMGFQQPWGLRTDTLSSNVKRIGIAVYGDNVDPCPKEYSIIWKGDNYYDIHLE